MVSVSMFDFEAPVFWCDGGCHDNGGSVPRAYGSYSDGKNTWTHQFPKLSTNNEAEYATLIRLLEQIPGASKCEIRTDSMLMVGQLTQDWKVKAQNLVGFYLLAKEQLERTGATLKWVPRKAIVDILGH